MSWIQTRSGKAFDLVDPRAKDVDFDDIAFALSHSRRFTGHAGGLSVAQHSVTVALQLPKSIRIYGLLHDAHEAYIGDISTPVKTVLAEADRAFKYALDTLESGVLGAIYAAAGIAPPNQYVRGAVKFADVTAMMTERQRMTPCEREWQGFADIVPLDGDPANAATRDLSAYEAEVAFRFYLHWWLPHLAPQAVAA